MVEVGPIFNNDHAKQKADEWIAHNAGWTWSGQWNTTIPGQMSVIEVTRPLPSNGEKKMVEVGPIFNNDHAKQKADEWIAHNPGWTWSGQWNTTVPGVMSVIEVTKQQHTNKKWV